jgi:cytochrome c nitrite reductase small subunit
MIKMSPLDPHVGAFLLGLVALAVLIGGTFFTAVPDSPRRHWMLLLALLVMPGIALLTGAGQILDDAKRPEFCGSCHVMTPWMNDLKNPESTTLAAVHYQNRYILADQCYGCHADYTMFGGVEAKWAGVNHLWKYMRGAYTLPLRIRSPFNTRNCLHCHGEAKVFRQAHVESQEQIDSGDLTCLDCHAPVHPEQPGE